MALVKARNDNGEVKDFNVPIYFTHVAEIDNPGGDPIYNFAGSHEQAKKINQSVAKEGSTAQIWEIIE